MALFSVNTTVLVTRYFNLSCGILFYRFYDYTGYQYILWCRENKVLFYSRIFYRWFYFKMKMSSPRNSLVFVYSFVLVFAFHIWVWCNPVSTRRSCPSPAHRWTFWKRTETRLRDFQHAKHASPAPAWERHRILYKRAPSLTKAFPFTAQKNEIHETRPERDMFMNKVTMEYMFELKSSYCSNSVFEYVSNIGKPNRHWSDCQATGWANKQRWGYLYKQSRYIENWNICIRCWSNSLSSLVKHCLICPKIII